MCHVRFFFNPAWNDNSPNLNPLLMRVVKIILWPFPYYKTVLGDIYSFVKRNGTGYPIHKTRIDINLNVNRF